MPKSSASSSAAPQSSHRGRCLETSVPVKGTQKGRAAALWQETLQVQLRWSDNPQQHDYSLCPGKTSPSSSAVLVEAGCCHHLHFLYSVTETWPSFPKPQKPEKQCPSRRISFQHLSWLLYFLPIFLHFCPSSQASTCPQHLLPSHDSLIAPYPTNALTQTGLLPCTPPCCSRLWGRLRGEEAPASSSETPPAAFSSHGPFWLHTALCRCCCSLL